MKFTQLILESNSPILYHRSTHKFKDGEILEAKLSSKYNSNYENILEEYRLLNKPNLPSRKKCFYLSPDLRSRFHYRGFLYQVKPLSQIHITNSNIIDNLGSSSMDGKKQIVEKLIKEYWNPGNKWVNKNQIRNIEVLCNKIQIISKVTKQTELFKDDNIKCIKEFEYLPDKPISSKLRKKLVDKEIIKYLSLGKIETIKKNTTWKITEINKANDFNLNKLNGNLYSVDLTNDDFTIELVIGSDQITNLNKFLKEHFIKL